MPGEGEHDWSQGGKLMKEETVFENNRSFANSSKEDMNSKETADLKAVRPSRAKELKAAKIFRAWIWWKVEISINSGKIADKPSYDIEITWGPWKDRPDAVFKKGDLISMKLAALFRLSSAAIKLVA